MLVRLTIKTIPCRTTWKPVKSIGVTREKLRDYIRDLTRMRTCFPEFPQDPHCWEVEEQYMFGSEYLVISVMKPGQGKIKAYLLYQNVLHGICGMALNFTKAELMLK